MLRQIAQARRVILFSPMWFKALGFPDGQGTGRRKRSYSTSWIASGRRGTARRRMWRWALRWRDLPERVG